MDVDVDVAPDGLATSGDAPVIFVGLHHYATDSCEKTRLFGTFGVQEPSASIAEETDFAKA